MSVNDWVIAGIMAYLLVGLFLADVILVHTSKWEYWFTLFLWPILIMGAFWIAVVLVVVTKLYELTERR